MHYWLTCVEIPEILQALYRIVYFHRITVDDNVGIGIWLIERAIQNLDKHGVIVLIDICSGCLLREYHRYQ